MNDTKYVKYIFDSPCENPKSFDSKIVVIENDISQKREEVEITRSLATYVCHEKTIKCFQAFFHFNNYELVSKIQQYFLIFPLIIASNN